jgi:hypothetical protein
MPRLVNGLPVDKNASDCMDSARLAGMMALADMPDAPDCTEYLNYLGLGVRHPNTTNPKETSWMYFSRDQMICLAAGLKAQRKSAIGMYMYLVNNKNHAQNFIEDDGSKKRFGGDYCLPHVMGAMAICAGQQRELTFIQKCFLITDLIVNRVFTPMREQNQIIALCYITGFLKLYRTLTPSYGAANMLYWNDLTPNAYNRGEYEIAEAINRKVKNA